LLINGDSLNELKKLDDNSVDLIVTDPPYGYSFMGKEWDKALPDKRIWKECLRVLKAGGFAYVMSAPRQDVLARMMIDLEDAGFKTDFTSMYWAYATGFPKALNISKAIDKKLGVERTEVIGSRKRNVKPYDDSNGWNDNNTQGEYEYKKPASEESKKLDGSYAGFQPKPAVEVIIVCMKPLSEKGYVDQAMKNGKGVSWFDDCRIPYDMDNENTDRKRNTSIKGGNLVSGEFKTDGVMAGGHINGRYPANLLVSDGAVDTGNITKSSGGINEGKIGVNIYGGGYTNDKIGSNAGGLGDTGDFSRYFDIDKWYESQFIITPKASKREKNDGLDDFEETIREDNKGHNQVMKNNHPTVKPLKLMSYLITLGSREGDVILDPFMGSGTTPLASKNLNRKYIGIEREKEYFKICCARVGDQETVLEQKDIVVEEKPKIEKEIIDEPIKEEPIIEEPSTICKICGVNYNGMTYEQHEQRPFHQDRL
jgi:site-specific DNA-methyltransferase (adenine-specific)